MKRIRNIEEAIPILKIEEGKQVMADGRASIVFEVKGDELESQSAEELSTFNQMVFSTLESLPISAIVQKMDVYDRRKFKGDSKAKDYFAGKDFEHFYNRPIMAHRCFLSFSFGQRK